MIVQREMANVKLKQHMKVQSSAIKAQSAQIVLFCDPLCMNVSSVCVSVCLVLSEPDHIGRLILQDHMFGVPETWWAKVDSCMPLFMRLYCVTTI